jgi:leader peptidase (prepilin peptidase)/N-methyltransferase
LAGAFIPIILSDVRENRIPNKIVVPLMILTLLCWLTLAIWQGEWLKFGISILLFVAITFAGLLLNHNFNVMGMGDVKLIATLAMILAWFSWGLALAFLPAVLVIAIVFGFFAVMTTEMTTLKLAPVVFATFGILLVIALN